MKLTPAQQRAAFAEHSVAVTAGAGTGKTSMLAARYLHHVTAHGLSPLSVAAVTFTEKAADELRARIRKTLRTDRRPDNVIAEVEAAQISTIHALAARVCRDFYVLAGIPADFAVLDPTESPIWLWEKFEEAIAGVDTAIIETLGFTWLSSALKGLLEDPYSAEKALEKGSDHWRSVVESERKRAIDSLIGSDAWAAAETTLTEISGPAGDKLEDARVSAIGAMECILAGENVSEQIVVLTKLQAHLGKAAAWPPGGKDIIGGCLKALKNEARLICDAALLEFGPDDDEAARRLGPLREALASVRTFLAEEKLRERVLDFADLEHYALKVLEHQAARDHYALRWKAVLVDEFQDTNPIQAEILERLTRGAKLTIVGDEKQAIYGFRGADSGVFTRVREQIAGKPGGMDVPLDRTFRAHQELVVQMNSVFEMVLGDIHQELSHERETSPLSPPFIRTAVVEDVKGALPQHQQMIEARYISDQVRRLHHEEGVAYGDIAIISRTWRPLEDYLRVLSADGIPAVHAGGGSLLDTREAKDVYSLLSFLIDPTDSIPLIAVLRSPFFGISDRTLYDAVPYGETTWWQAIHDRPAFAHAVETLEILAREMPTSSAERIVRRASSLTGYEAVIANLPFGSRRLADLRGMFELFRKLERRGRGDVFGSVRYMRELIETKTVLPRPHLEVGDAVSLMTIHMAKGLEWPVVFVPDLAAKENFSTPQVLVDQDLGVAFQIESDGFDMAEPAIYKLVKQRRRARERGEETRLLYVAITRAEEMVYLTSTKATGPAIDILRPGLDASGIVDEVIPFDPARTIAPAPAPPSVSARPVQIQADPLEIGLAAIPATALSIYARCPARFRWQYVEGHPGIADGSTSAMQVGSLAHLALELDIDNAEALRRHSLEASDQDLARALAFAAAFSEREEFAAIRSAEIRREVPFLSEQGPVSIAGTADVVGPDFVLDYKTDSMMSPEEHRFQIWAYARAFGRSRGLIAYLAHNALFEFDSDALAAIDEEAHEMLRAIGTGKYDATPAENECSRCGYSQICEFRFEIKEGDEK